MFSRVSVVIGDVYSMYYIYARVRLRACVWVAPNSWPFTNAMAIYYKTTFENSSFEFAINWRPAPPSPFLPHILPLSPNHNSFAKVSVNLLDDDKASYQHSDQEKADVKAAYLAAEGDMDGIMVRPVPSLHIAAVHACMQHAACSWIMTHSDLKC